MFPMCIIRADPDVIIDTIDDGVEFMNNFLNLIENLTSVSAFNKRVVNYRIKYSCSSLKSLFCAHKFSTSYNLNIPKSVISYLCALYSTGYF